MSLALAFALGLGVAFSAAHGHGSAPHEQAGRAVQPPAVDMPLMGGVRSFTPPVAGSYALPPIRQAADGKVLDSEATATTLHEVYDDRLVLLSFVFTTCSDAMGCPLATGVMHRVHREMQRDAELGRNLRLVTLSFAPEHDTPEVMRQYAAVASGEADWRFLTTASEQALEPILRGYDQHLIKEYDASGQFTGNYSHVLRVYLIDRDNRVRNMYSSSYLYPELLLADVRSLLLEERGGESAQASRGDRSGG